MMTQMVMFLEVQTSPIDSAIAIVVDAIGEWDTISVWECSYKRI